MYIIIKPLCKKRFRCKEFFFHMLKNELQRVPTGVIVMTGKNSVNCRKILWGHGTRFNKFFVLKSVDVNYDRDL